MARVLRYRHIKVSPVPTNMRLASLQDSAIAQF